MPSTDYNGEAIMILSAKEACYIYSVLCNNTSVIAKKIVQKCREVVIYGVSNEINK